MLQKILIRVIWFVCLALSIALSIFFFLSLSKVSYYQKIIPVAVITVESLAQIILSYGKAEWRAGLYGRAIVKMFLYSVYIIFFGILSGLSYFMSHIAANERVVDNIARQETVLREQWEQNNRLIESLNKHLLTEGETGFRRRSETIMNEIKRLKDEQSQLIAKIESAVPQEETMDIFRDMAEVIGISANKLKLASFGVFLVFIYAGLIILNPNVTIVISDVTKNTTNSVTGVTGAIAKKPASVTGVTGQCPVCNGPLKPGQTYCGNRCRQKAFRERRANHATV